MRDAICHRFDEDWLTAVLEGKFAGSLDRFTNGPNVVAVDADGVDAVADASGGNAVSTVLFQCGC